jgi:hypothetical protein
MDFGLMLGNLGNKSRRLLCKLHNHVISLFEWYAYYAELN